MRFRLALRTVKAVFEGEKGLAFRIVEDLLPELFVLRQREVNTCDFLVELRIVLAECSYCYVIQLKEVLAQFCRVVRVRIVVKRLLVGA